MKSGPFTGGARRRLKIEARGDVELFVVNNVDEVVARINEWMGKLSG